MATRMVLGRSLAEDVVSRIRGYDIEVVEAGSTDAALEAIGEADCYFGPMTPELLARGTKLRWIQATSAGLDGYFFPELRESDVVVTNLRGIYSDVIADHVFAFILTFARGLHVYHRSQARGTWEKGAPVIHLGTTTIGIIGLGGIGLEVARRAAASSMRILAVDPAPKDTPDYVERIYDPSDVDDVLAQSDFIVICVPHTGETEYLIDADALGRMKDSAILVNIGRGKVVDLQALTSALQNGRLGGAALDVFEEEPLPAGHPLWSQDNVLITPHVAGVSPEIQKRREDVIVENARRFDAGEPLLNVVDKKRGYVVEKNPQ